MYFKKCDTWYCEKIVAFSILVMASSDAALVVMGVIAIIAVGIAVFLLIQPPVAVQPSTVIVREPVWRPLGSYYQHLPRHHLVY